MTSEELTQKLSIVPPGSRESDASSYLGEDATYGKNSSIDMIMNGISGNYENKAHKGSNKLSEDLGGFLRHIFSWNLGLLEAWSHISSLKVFWRP